MDPMKLLSLLLALVVLALPAAGAERAERTIHKEVLIDAPLEQAWAAWTTRDGIVSFMAPDAQIDARVGGAFHIYFDPFGAPGLKGADDMRYMALQPMRMLSFDWSAPPHLPEARKQRTFVVLHFEPVGGRQTRLSLTHVGWGDGGEWDKAFTYFDRAWSNVFANLQKRFQTGPIDWTDWMNQLRKMHAQADAKK
jgi:uncharacterized protein YndB with AHSA1/START domain